jgi:hypothetical protein
LDSSDVDDETTEITKTPTPVNASNQNSMITHASSSTADDKPMTMKKSTSGIEFKYYDIDFKYNGLAIMIVIHEFTNPERNFKPQVYDPELDIQSFKVLQDYNYKLVIKKNQTKAELLSLISFYTHPNFDYSNYASFFFCITSHGREDKIVYSSDEEEIDRNKHIIEPFYNVKELSKKPKFFLFDCCRGAFAMRVIHKGTMVNKGNIMGVVDKNIEIKNVYDTKNFFLGFATVESFTATIDVDWAKRSFFIWSFFDVLKEHDCIDWLDLTVATSNKMEENGCKHPPSFESRSPCKFEFVKKNRHQPAPSTPVLLPISGSKYNNLRIDIQRW